MQAESSPQPGQLVGGKYRIVRTLGRGAMGVVFEAQHVATGKRVAVKWLHAHVMESRSAVERLVREAQASARVRHSNVVDVYDVEREGDAMFLVMEYLEGEPLSSWLERGGVPVHELLTVIVQAMRGVNEAHRRGIVHRDIKPDNIFMAEEADLPAPIAKVLDFGVSKIENPGGLSLTQTGSALGTPLYMSYEQLSGLRDVDARSDVYSFGVILYEALTGTLPFTADNFAELAAKVITSEPVPPRRIRPDLPERLEEIVLWAMKKRREERTPNLSVLIDALQPFTQPARDGSVSMSSARLPAVAEVATSPVSSTPAPPPSTPGLRLDEQTDWNAVLHRSQRERREMEDRVTALVAGTMYGQRKKRNEGRGFWAGMVAVGAIALGITLATLMRDSRTPTASDQPAEQPAAQTPTAAAPPAKTPTPAERQPEPTASATGAVAPVEPEVLKPAAPTQVESVQMPKPAALRVDAGLKQPLQQRAQPGALPKASAPRAPAYEGPSGELVTPPPAVYAPPVQQPVAPVEELPVENLPAAPTPKPAAPADPVDVNPFEGEGSDPGGEPYRAGRPREDEF